MYKRIKWCTQCDYTTEDLSEEKCPVCEFKPHLIEVEKKQ